MKNRKFAYLLLGAAALAGLTACGASTNKSSNDKNDGNTFKITTVRWSDWGEDYHKGFLDDSAKESGIKIKWDTMVAADWSDKKSVLVASGDLPDAFLGSNAFTDSEIAQNQNMFIPLEDLIKDNMPNLNKAFEKEAMVTNPDGHIYSLPKKLPMRPIVGNQLFINKKWLDNLGLKMPETYDELVTVLQAFKDKDANGNGDVNDEIPFGSGNFDPTFSYILPFNNRLGGDNTYEMSVKDGKPVYLRTEESYKQGIAAMHEAYKKGLIDPELFTEDTSMSVAKRMDKGVARVGVSSGWTADATFGQHASEYAPLPALKGPDGKQYVISDPDHLNYGRRISARTLQNCSNGWINSTRMMLASKTSMDPLVLRLKKMAISTRSWLQKMVNQPMNGLGSIPFVTLDQNMCLMISIVMSTSTKHKVMVSN